MTEQTSCYDQRGFSCNSRIFRISVREQVTGNYNQFHNILRLFDLLPNFPSTTSEMMDDYYL